MRSTLLAGLVVGGVLTLGWCVLGCSGDSTTGDDGGEGGGGGSSSGGKSSSSSSSSSSGGASSSSGGSNGPIPTGACVIKQDIRSSTTWSKAACPDGYLVKYETRVTNTGTELRIEPGTVVKFDGSGAMMVEEGASLIAEGNAAERIRFTSLQGAVGTWSGIRIRTSSALNKIGHATIEHAGGGSDPRPALTIGSTLPVAGRMELHDLEISDNAHTGLGLFGGGTKLPVFTNVAMRRNAKAAAHVQAPLVDQIKGTNNAFEGIVTLETSSLLKLTEDAVWPSVSPAVYRVVGQNGSGGDLIRIEKHLEIEAGAVFELASGSGFVVAGGTAGLKAVGTPDQKIIFRGVNDSAWTGITFGESTWTDNRLENVEIRNASMAPSWGFYATGSPAVRKAGLLLGYNKAAAVNVMMMNVSITGPNNAAADVAVKSGTTLNQQGTVTGTAAGGGLEIESF